MDTNPSPELPAMKLETFKKGVTDFTRLIEKAHIADLKLVQENNVVTSWILGLYTGAFIFIIANNNDEFKLIIKDILPVLIVLQGVQVFFALVLRIFIKSYSVLTEQQLLFLGLQEMYLEVNPKNDKLKEHDLFSFYEKLSQYYYLVPLMKDIIDKFTGRKKIAGGIIAFSFLMVVLIFLVNYYLFLFALWEWS